MLGLASKILLPAFDISFDWYILFFEEFAS